MNIKRILTTLISLPLALAFGGCVITPDGFINQHIPNGTIGQLNLVVGVTGGAGGTITGKNITKTSTEITAQELHVTIHDIVNPVFQLDVVNGAGAATTMQLK